MSVSPFRDFPLAEASRRWSGAAAEKRVRAWAGATNQPNQKYREAHLWYDKDKKDEFTAHKLLIADVVNGELKVVPRAVTAAAGIIDGARGGIDVPAADVNRIRSHLAKYYNKLGETPPWDA